MEDQLRVKNKMHRIRHALNKEGRLVLVGDVAQGLRCECTCSHCGEPLTAKKGATNRHHFSHLPSTNCSIARESDTAGETQLHSIAKRYLAALTTLVFPPPCYSGIAFDSRGNLYRGKARASKQPIKLQGVSSRLEMSLGDIIPDLIVNDGAHDYLVEVAVTHRVDPLKLEKIRSRGISCIELNLKHLLNIEWQLGDIKAAIANATCWQWIYYPQEQVLRAQAQILAEAEAAKHTQQYELEAAAEKARKEAEDAARAAQEAARAQALAEHQERIRKEAERQRRAEFARQEEARRAEFARQEEARRAELARQEEARRAQQVRAEQQRQQEIERARAAAEERVLRDARIAAEVTRRDSERKAMERQRTSAVARMFEVALPALTDCTSREPAPNPATNADELTQLKSLSAMNLECARMAAVGPGLQCWLQLKQELSLEWDNMPSYLNIAVPDEMAFVVDRRIWQSFVFWKFIHRRYDGEGYFSVTLNAWADEVLAPAKRTWVTPSFKSNMWMSDYEELPSAKRALAQYLDGLVQWRYVERLRLPGQYAVLSGPNKGFTLFSA